MGDYYNIINTATEDAERRGHQAGLEEGLAQGREEGLKEGRAEGHTEAKTEIARKMLAAGMSVEQVLQFTGLNKETIEKL